MTRRKSFSGRVSDVDIRLMRIFKTVIECGGLSAAQTELGVGRSTISRQISDLETRLGVRLCHRGRSGFSLTQQGEQTLKYIEQFFVSIDDFGTKIASINNRLIGKIEIGMMDYTVSDANNPLVKSIRKFREIAPNVSINLMSGSPNEIERGVIDGRMHIGIVPDYQRHPGLRYFHLYDEEVGLFCGGDHPIACTINKGQDVSEQTVYRHELVNRSYAEGERIRSLKDRFPAGSTVYQTEAIMALVQSGIFLGFFPTHSPNTLNEEVHEVLPAAFRYSTSICAIWRGDRSHSSVLKDFLKILCVKEKIT